MRTTRLHPRRRWRRLLLVAPLVLAAGLFAHARMRAHFRHVAIAQLHRDRAFLPPASFPADTYPSEVSAVRGLAAQLPAAIADVTPEPRQVEITGDLSAEQIDFFRRAVNAVIVTDVLSDSAGGDVRISVKRVQHPSIAAHGTFQVDVGGERGKRALTAAFADKPWVERLSQFVSTHPRRNWLVGRSGPCGSEADALREAREDAAAVVREMIRQRIGRANGRDADRVLASVNADDLVVDQFAQRFARPYGDVWSASVLAEIPAQRLDALAHQYTAQVQVSHIHRVRAIAAGGALLIALWLLYTAANAVTRGYYTTRLRVASVLLAAAGILILA